jgi:hypothetical protein
MQAIDHTVLLDHCDSLICMRCTAVKLSVKYALVHVNVRNVFPHFFGFRGENFTEASKFMKTSVGEGRCSGHLLLKQDLLKGQ